MPAVKAQLMFLTIGLPPVEDYSFNDYHLRLEPLDEQMLAFTHDLEPIYHPVHLYNNLYSIGQQHYYQVFQNDSLMWEVSDDVYLDLNVLREEALNEAARVAAQLQSALRLITNYPLLFPYIHIRLLDSRITDSRDTSGLFTNSGVQRATFTNDDVNRILRRLQTGYSWDSINDTMDGHPRYSRALRFYLDAFDTSGIGTKFALLFTALESLFHLMGNKERVVSTDVRNFKAPIPC